jgi:hypothetical protein
MPAGASRIVGPSQRVPQRGFSWGFEVGSGLGLGDTDTGFAGKKTTNESRTNAKTLRENLPLLS